MKIYIQVFRFCYDKKMVVKMARSTGFNPLNWTHLLLITTTIIACIAMAFVIVLNFCNKALVSMITVVKANHNFIDTPMTTTPATNIDTHQMWLDFQDLFSNILTEEILILFILILILLLLATFFIHRCYVQKKRRKKLILEIISDTSIFRKTVLSLRYCAEFYRLNVQQSDFILSPTFIGYNLHLGTSIDILELPREIKLNFARTVYLNPLESFLAGKILNSRHGYSAILILLNNKDDIVDLILLRKNSAHDIEFGRYKKSNNLPYQQSSMTASAPVVTFQPVGQNIPIYPTLT